MAEPRLPLTVDYGVWRAVADAVRPEFADSYLSGAVQIGKHVTTRTAVAYDRLIAHRQATAALADLDIKLVRCLPFNHPNRVDYAP